MTDLQKTLKEATELTASAQRLRDLTEADWVCALLSVGGDRINLCDMSTDTILAIRAGVERIANAQERLARAKLQRAIDPLPVLPTVSAGMKVPPTLEDAAEFESASGGGWTVEQALLAVAGE